MAEENLALPPVENPPPQTIVDPQAQLISGRIEVRPIENIRSKRRL